MKKQTFTFILGALFLIFNLSLRADNPPLINNYQDRNTVFFTEDSFDFAFSVNDEITKVTVNGSEVSLNGQSFNAPLINGDNAIETFKTINVNGFPMESKVADYTIKGKKISYLITNAGNAQPGNEVTITFDALDAPMYPVPSVVNPNTTKTHYETNIPGLASIQGQSAGAYGSINPTKLNTLTFTIPTDTPEGDYTLSPGSIYVKWWGQPIYEGQPQVSGQYEYYFSTLPEITVHVSNDAVGDVTPPEITTSLFHQETISKYLSFTASALDAVDGNITPVVTLNNVEQAPVTPGNYDLVVAAGPNTVKIIATDASNNEAEKIFTITYKQEDAINDIIAKIDNLPGVDAITLEDRVAFYEVYNLYLSFSAEEMAMITNSDKVEALKVKMDELDESVFQNYNAYYPMFRKDAQNTGIVNIQLPTSQAQTAEKWATKYGSGMFGAVGTPLVVNNELYVVASNKLRRINKETGEELAVQTMAGSMGFHCFPAYGEGKIFVPIGSGRIQAFNAETLESLWISTTYPNESTNSTVIYHNGFVYSASGEAGLSNSDNGHFFCLDATDDDPTKTDEVKDAVWSYQIPEGRKAFYWAGGAIAGDYIYFGGDNGEVVAHHLTNDEVLDTYQGSGDIRSTVAYDDASNSIFFSSKGGNLYKLPLNANGSFDKANAKSVSIGPSTSSPSIYNGRVYVCSGVMGSTEGGINVVDANTMELIYKAHAGAAYQSSPIVCTAYATPENNNTVYVYCLPNGDNSSINMLKDFEGNTEEDRTKIFTPSQTQMCTQSLVCDAQGNFYYSNDSGHLFAVGNEGPVTDPPVVSNELADVYVEKNAAEMTIALADVFSDPDDENASFTYNVSSDNDLVTTSIDGTDLKLNFVADQSGTANITVTANSNGLQAEDDFTVSVMQGFDEITNWVGEGANQAAIQIQWNDGINQDALAWGYRWDGEAKGEDMIKAIAAADPRFFYMSSSTPGLGSAIGGMGYDVALNHLQQIKKEDGEPIAPNAEGIIPIEGYDFDGWAHVNANDHYQGGWNSSFWGYFMKDNTASEWQLSNLGISNLPLTDGCWNALMFTPLSKQRTRFTDAKPEAIYHAAAADTEAPTVANALGEILLDAGLQDPQTISLAGVFTDADNNDLYITSIILNNTNPSQVEASIEDNELHLNFLTETIDQTEITIQGESNGKVVEDVISIRTDIVDYTKGIFVVNEDWFGTDNGSVNFMDEYGNFKYRVYRAENDGEKLGITTQFGTVYGENFYLVSKQGHRLVVADANTMKKKAVIDEIGADGRAFVGVTPSLGYISTSNGIYQFDIENLTVGEMITGTDGQTGNMLKVGKYVFAVQANKVLVLENNAVSSTITGEAYGGMTLGANGKVYIGAGSKLIEINPSDLSTSAITLPSGVSIPSSWGAWNAGSLTSSVDKNYIYWGVSSGWSGAKDLYRYEIGNPSSLDAPFITLDDPYELYGAGMRIQPETNNVIVTGKKSGWGANSEDNVLVKYDGTTGEKISSTQLENYYWFPATIAFPDQHAPELELANIDLFSGDEISYLLNDILLDPEHNPATFELTINSNSNEDAVEAVIENGNLTFTATATEAASADIELSFTSNGKVATKTVTVNVSTIDYTKGAFIVNEDWFGTDNGSVNFFTEDQNFVYRAYRKENNGEKLGVTTQYGTIYGGNFYLVSKQDHRLVVTDATTLEKKAVIDNIGGADGRAFIGITPELGYISTSNGIYQFDITNLTVGEMIAGTEGQVGNMLKAGNYIFAVQSDKVLVIKDNTVESTITGASYCGITISKDGNVWIGAGDKLVKVDPFTLASETINLPDNANIPSTWGAWNANSLCASLSENSLYWIKSAGMFGGSNIVCKYTIGDETSLEEPFFTMEDTYVGYGAGIRIEPTTNMLYLTAKKDGWGANSQDNKLFIYNAETGEKVSDHKLADYYWFPATIVFPDNSVPALALENFEMKHDEVVDYTVTDLVSDADNNVYSIDLNVTSISDAELLEVEFNNNTMSFSALKNETKEVEVSFEVVSNGKVIEKTITVKVIGTVGINEVVAEKAKLYPQPFNNQLNIEVGNDNIGSQYIIRSITGQEVLSGTIESTTETINTAQLDSGAYIIIIQNNNLPIVKKMIKQ